MKEELRELMHIYGARYKKLQKGYKESKESGDEESMVINKALQRQCRVMIAELWDVMFKIGALDEEEIEFGSIKIKK